VLLSCVGARRPGGLRLLELSTGRLTDVRLSVDEVPDERYLPTPELMTFPGPGGREVHAIVYRPANADFEATAEELPPYLVSVHGGPTTQSKPALDLEVAYFTSRGIGVLDVNYGGSTGYGREYRDRLKGQWGVVDVEDTVAAVQGLVARGLADPARLAIAGGSAGGFTVLAALTGTDVFACGTSYFGVADLMKLFEHTHDFESRYLVGLVGPLPEAAELYRSRSPLYNVAGLSCPVLLLQGLKDPVVPPEQAELFRDAMVAKGIPHAYLTFANESHGFREADSQIRSREAELSFYGQVFGFTPPGVPELELWRPSAD
jgi:dipeptidyl aminopeptidase/acylaminoacyl peptidase